MKEDQKAKRLRLWKARQEAEGHDVSGVTTLEQAAHFFDKKEIPEPPAEPEIPEIPEVDAEPEIPEAPQKTSGKRAKKPKEV